MIKNIVSFGQLVKNITLNHSTSDLIAAIENCAVEAQVSEPHLLAEKSLGLKHLSLGQAALSKGDIELGLNHALPALRGVLLGNSGKARVLPQNTATFFEGRFLQLLRYDYS